MIKCINTCIASAKQIGKNAYVPDTVVEDVG